MPRYIWEPSLIAGAIIAVGFALQWGEITNGIHLFVANAFVAAAIRCWAIRTGFDMRKYNRDDNG
jgi:hypothetical protein